MTTDRLTTNLSVLGAGSWGTALALLLANNLSGTKQKGHVALWGRDRRLLEEMRRTRRNTVFLPKRNLPSNVPIQTRLPAAASALSGRLAVSASMQATFLFKPACPPRRRAGLRGRRLESAPAIARL